MVKIHHENETLKLVETNFREFQVFKVLQIDSYTPVCNRMKEEDALS
jgi:hypothetical protein